MIKSITNQFDCIIFIYRAKVAFLQKKFYKMKHNLLLVAMMAAAAASFTIGKANAAEPTDTASLARCFARIDDEARPQVWWHWMDGNVTREGIRKDLEWMKASGIGGLHQFDAGGINMPRAVKEKLPYMTEGWKDAFRYALDVADSLGLEVTIASAPGWSSTGGRWVKPEDAVKKLEWRSIDIRSNGKVETRLPELYRTVGPYQDCFQGNDRIEVKPYGEDLFVLAVRRSVKDLSMEEMGATITQDDSTITCHLPKARKIKALTLKTGSTPGRPRSGEIRYRSILEASSDDNSSLTEDGLHSTVISASLSIEKHSPDFFNIAEILSPPKNDGVPPPKYTVSKLPFTFSAYFSMQERTADR